MSYMKGVKPGSEGNTRLQSQYGGGSTPPRQDYPKGYATGGGVKGNPALNEGLAAADGPSAKPVFGRSGKKKAPSKDKSGPKINIVIAQAPKDQAAAMPMPPMPPGPPGPPPGGPPMAGPPMPPPDAGGGPPMPPMRASGGRVVTRKTGGKVCKADGGETTGKDEEGGVGEYLRERGKEAVKKGEASAGLGSIAAGTGLAGMIGATGRLRRIAAPALAAVGLGGTGKGILEASQGDAMKSAAKRWDKLDLPERKSGGKVCKQDGGGLGGKSRLDGQKLK